MTLSIPDKIALVLGSLGETGGEVADALAERGIKGKRQSGCDCPIAEILKREVPETAGMFAMISGYWIGPDQVLTGGMGDPVDVPDGVADFIYCFDHEGMYPHLDSEATP